MKIAAISDTHSYHWQIKEFLPADLFIFAGDMTQMGSEKDLTKFAKWLGNLPYEHRIVISGNHDFCFERNGTLAKQIIEDTGSYYLEDKSIIIEGLKIYGTPWQPIFFDWAFNRNETSLTGIFSNIPIDTDILITHCPPYGYLDLAPGYGKINRFDLEHTGSKALLDRLLVVKPKLHIFGHIHEGRGQTILNNTILRNVSFNPIDKQLYYMEI